MAPPKPVLAYARMFTKPISLVYHYGTNHPKHGGLSDHFITHHDSVGFVGSSLAPCAISWAAVVWGPY